ncbi:MAG: NAD(P)/FAD-dependent oxidoreductase [Actinobacteria bacterium]|nr:NAD(P)/FAD-dependent oxidoreductase [Actinomycetota bacterium]
MTPGEPTHHVVVIGGGFAGLSFVRALRERNIRITLVDRRNFHLFQPLLYQVATSGLSPGEIAIPLRKVLKRRRDVTVVLADVVSVDVDGKAVVVQPPAEGASPSTLSYDTLVVAAGAMHSYFGHEDWADRAPGLKSIEDALELRRRILIAFEAAETETDPARREAWLTFLVVGGGPTGVELAGQIAEIANDTLRNEYRSIDPGHATIYLVEAAGRVLGVFPASLSARAADALKRLGVTVKTGFSVSDIGADHVLVTTPDQTEEIRARTVLWAAGVEASPVAGMLARAAGAATDRAGRVVVAADLTLPSHPDVFVLGDMARALRPDSDEPFPGIAPVAMQQGRHAARAIRARLRGERSDAGFRYRDRGHLATIGRLSAVGVVGGMRVSGRIAWLMWLVVHIRYLVGFQNRALVVARWAVSFATRGRGARLITGQPDAATLPGPPDRADRER